MCVWGGVAHTERKEHGEQASSGQIKRDIVGSLKKTNQNPGHTMGFILRGMVCYHKILSRVGEVYDQFLCFLSNVHISL